MLLPLAQDSGPCGHLRFHPHSVLPGRRNPLPSTHSGTWAPLFPWFPSEEVSSFPRLEDTAEGELQSGGLPSFFFFLIFIYLFIFGCVGSSFLCEGSL